MAHARTKRDGGGDAPDLGHFRQHYPLTVANFGALPEREAWLRRVWLAESRWRNALDASSAREFVVRSAPPASLSVAGEFEIVYVGGAVATLHAAVLACRYGRRVLVLREGVRASGEATSGGARVWKVSREEIGGLERAGLFTPAEIEAATVNRFRTARVKFHDEASRLKAPPLEVAGVLDAALDANQLLTSAESKFKAREGCAVVECGRVVRVYVERHRVSVEVEDARGARTLHAARLYVDARGAASDAARQLGEGHAFTHVAPTVGTVARGFARGEGPDRADFGVGDLLITTEDASRHRQLIWGGFGADARREEFTTQLSFYDKVSSPADKSLLALFEQYFEKLPRYKRAGAQWRVVRPVFGYHASHAATRGWKAGGARATDRVLLVADDAARANPFASSGAGASLRDLHTSTHLTELALAADLLDAASLSEIGAETPRAAHAAQLAEFLRPVENEREEPSNVNETLNAVMAALHELDERVRRELFQDRLSFGALRSLASRTVQLYPRILQRVRQRLGARGTFLWLAHLTEAAFRERRDARDAETDFDPRDEEAAREFSRHVALYKKGRGD